MNELLLDMSPRAAIEGLEVRSIGEIMPAVLALHGLQEDGHTSEVTLPETEQAPACC